MAENLAGSALSAAMLGLLLDRSDPRHPATSYALLNSVALLGMRVGTYLSGYAGDYGTFCCVALGINVCFTLMTAVLSCQNSTDVPILAHEE